MGASTATIEVTTSFVWFSYFQLLARPVIEVDGQASKGSWGRRSFAVTPGQHTLKAYHHWAFYPQAYASSTSIDVPERQTIRLRWHTGWSVMSPGRWSVVTVA